LLVLKTEKGVIPEGMQVASRKGKETDFPLFPSEKNAALPTP
jgi:hypothetical protein